MRLILNVTNKSFETAFALVARDHSHLLSGPLEFIKLCKKNEMIWNNAYGIHKRTPRETSQIFICNGKRSVPEFVNTIVHELKHFEQHETQTNFNKHQMEDEAYLAGRKAQLLYEGKF